MGFSQRSEIYSIAVSTEITVAVTHMLLITQNRIIYLSIDWEITGSISTSKLHLCTKFSFANLPVTQC